MNPEIVALIKHNSTTMNRHNKGTTKITKNYYAHIKYQQVGWMLPGKARERIYANVKEQYNILQDYDNRVLPRV